jgi:hypothetical protein
MTCYKNPTSVPCHLQSADFRGTFNKGGIGHHALNLYMTRTVWRVGHRRATGALISGATQICHAHSQAQRPSGAQRVSSQRMRSNNDDAIRRKNCDS